MFPLKRFVQGPSLHDEQISYTENNEVSSNSGQFSGDEASKIYEEIINLPSTSSSVIKVDPEESFQGNVKSNESECDISEIPPPELTSSGSTLVIPKLSQLMSYCESNSYSELAKVLKLRNLNINSVDEYGWTMLMSASCAGSTECVSLLLQHGASWEIKDKKGFTASSLALKNRHEHICNLIEEWNECYVELCQRKLQSVGSTEEHSSVENETNPSDNPGPSRRFCDSCEIHYSSSKNDHNNSIAHLVCTAQFSGVDKAHYGIPESNVGFQLMVKSGWDRNRGLGPEGKGHKFPVKTVLKRNKLGLGNEKERKMARITHFAPFDPAAVEGQERSEREETVRKREAVHQRNKQKRKEINFRREFSSL